MKHFSLLIFLLIGLRSISQEGIFIKFGNAIPLETVSSLVHRVNTTQDLSISCPFTLESEDLLRTYVLSDYHKLPTKARKLLTPYLEYIEEIPDYQFFYTPNDYTGTLWNLNMINAQQAWDESQGDNVTIAIVDDAVEITHSDLNANIWTNPGEIAGNGIDDDGNGYIDDTNGWDAANLDNDPAPPSTATSSYFSHGTHCAGIASAVTDNGNGISSIGFNAKIIPVKIADDATSMLTAAYSGVNYAIAVNANVISMSWGGGAYSVTYQNLFDYAYNQGIICVAAAGNNNSSAPMYPASYNHVIAVGSTDNNDNKSSFSNYGSTIDVMAPGSGIYSTVPNNSYGFKSGTSMACPLVSGLVSLMISKNTALTPDEVEDCLESSCDNIDNQNPLFVGSIGAGRVNAYGALQCVSPIFADFESDAVFTCENGQIQFTDLSNNNPISWEWSFPGGTPNTSSAQNPLITYSTSGVYDVQLIVQNQDGADTLLATNYITVDIPTAQISGSATIVQGAAAVLNITLSGNPPFDYEYTDGSSNFTVTGVQNYIDQQIVTPTNTTTYSLLNMNDSGCSGVVSGAATVDIIQPVSGSCGAYSVSTFHKELESSINDKIRGIHPTIDDGLVILAASESGFGLYDYSIIKLDDNYNLEWSKAIGTSYDDAFTFSDIHQDDLGNIYFTGSSQYSSSSREAELVKLDPLGNTQFITTFDEIYFDKFISIFTKSNGNTVCVGSTNGVISSSDCLITEFDSNGNLVYSNVLGKGGNDHLHFAMELSNGNILALGSTNGNGSISSSGLMMIFDSNWNPLFENSYSLSSGRELFQFAIEKPNGNFLIQGEIIGSTNDKVTITEMTPSGNMVWSKSYEAQGTVEVGDLIELLNGTYAFGWGSRTTLEEFYLANIDDLGNLIWSKKLPTTSPTLVNNTSSLICNTNDGGIIMASHSENITTGIDNINLFKFDLCGNLGCGETDYGLNISSETATTSTPSFSSILVGSVSSNPHSEQLLTFNEDTICDVSIGGSSCGSYSVSTFHKEFQSSIDDKARAMSPTSDGGVIILGASQAGFGDYDFNVIKMDNNYDVEWSKHIGTVGDDASSFGDIIEDGQGNFILVGTSRFASNNWSSTLIKLDPSGNILFTSSFQNNYLDTFSDVFVRSNGNIVVVGTTNNVISSSDCLILEFDSNGNLLHSEIIGKGGNDHLLFGTELSNGNILALGSTDNSSSNSTGLMMIFDPNWNLIFKESYDFATSSNEYFQNAILKPNGNLLIQGRIKPPTQRISVTEMTQSGTIVWTKSYSTPGAKSSGIIELANGTYGMAWSSKNTIEEFYLANLDDLGNVVWSKQLPTSSYIVTNETSNLICNSNDGGILYLSHSENSSTNVANLNLMKFDICGNMDCGETDYTIPQVATESAVISPPSFSTASTGAMVPRLFSEQTYSFVDSLICGETIPPTCDIIADFNVTLPPCLDDSVLFDDLSTSSSSNIIYWHWDFDDGTVVSGDSTYYHQYQSTGSYDVQLIVGTDDGCYDTLTQTVTLNNNWQISMDDSTICMNDSIQLFPEINCIPDTFTVAWTPTTGISDPQILNPVVSPSSSTTYTITITDQGGSTYSSDVDISVNTSCCVSYADFEYEESVCIGESLSFSNTSSSTGATNYMWNFGPNATPSTYNGITPTNVTYNSSGTYNITLTLTDDCGSDTITYPIYINPLPKINIIEDTLSCINDTIFLGNSTIGNYIYNWTPGHLVSDSTSSNPYAIADTTPVDYILTVTDPFTGCSSNEETTVSGEACPCDLYPEFTLDTLICLDDSVEVIDHSLNLLGDIDYRMWNFGDGTTVMNDSISYHTYSSSGTYTIELVIGLDTLCYDTIAHTVEVIDLPNVPIISDTILCIGDTLFVGYTTDTNLTYSWSPASIFSNNLDANPSVMVDSVMNITLEVTTLNNGCSNVQSVKIKGEDCNCYFEIPNVFTPNKDGLNETFRVNYVNCEVSTLTIFNRWGQVIFTGNKFNNSWDGRTADGQEVREGTYYYLVTVNGLNYSGFLHLFR